jgi:hypothetical protein
MPFLGWPRTSTVVAQTFHNVSKLRRKVLLDYIVMMWQYALGRREEQIATAVGPTKAGMIVPQPLPVLHARMRVHCRDGGIALATLSPSPGPRASGAFVPRRSLAARRACMRPRFSFDCEEEDPSEESDDHSLEDSRNEDISVAGSHRRSVRGRRLLVVDLLRSIPLETALLRGLNQQPSVLLWLSPVSPTAAPELRQLDASKKIPGRKIKKK